MASSEADLNLLIGVLALQMDFITREALVAGTTAWTRDRCRRLDQILVEQGSLQPVHQELLAALVQAHLKAHGNDVEQSLAAVRQTRDAVAELRVVADAEVEASLARMTSQTEADPNATRPWQGGTEAANGSRFQVLRPHARGGLGLVSVALDAELHREVALKEIQPQHADDPESRARFLLEAEITGRLEHPGVVPVYGLGVNGQGRPFYAMRFVRGESLKEAIERFYRLETSSPGERSLAFRQLLRRFIDVCNAVAYAHDRGVIHRDLKPANILLGPYGETLVVDWGLAKVVGRQDVPAPVGEATLRPSSGSGSSETVAGAAVGTPAYMSPEQAEGRVNAVGSASDVYSLGATLYVLLSGQPPFDGSVETMLARVRRGDFVPPRTRSREVPRELNAVCLKAMARNPADRYATPRALSEDIEHWLADEPVSAYRDSTVTRLARWGRRHRSFVVGAAALLATSVVALTGGLILLQQAGERTERQRRLAVANYLDAQRQRDLARANFEMARRAVDESFTEVSENTLLQSPLPDLQPLRKRLLESVVKYYQEFAAKGGNDPALRAELAKAYLRVGTVTGEIGSTDDALQALQHARELYEALSQADPSRPEYRGDLALTYRAIGRMVAASGRLRESEEPFRKAVALDEQLISTNPNVAEYQSNLAWCYNNLGAVASRTGRAQEARRSYERAIAAWRRLVDTDPRPEFRVGLSLAETNLGWSFHLAGKVSEALEATQQAVITNELVVQENPSNVTFRSRLAHSLDNLGHICDLGEQRERGRTALDRALTVAEPLARENPAVIAFQEDLIAAHNDLGHLLLHVGEDAEAYRQFETALELARKLPKGTPDAFSYAYINRGLGKCLLKQGKDQAARDAFEKAVHVGETEPGEKPYATYELACARALLSHAIIPGGSDEQAMKKRYADQAVEALHQAVAEGWEHLEWLKADPDLSSLRERRDFQELLKALEERRRAEAAGS